MSSCTLCERHTESTFRVEGMCCHTEAATLERRLHRLAGIHRLSIDIVGQRLRIAYDAAKTTTSTIAEAIAETGMRAWLDPDRHTGGARSTAAGAAASPAPAARSVAADASVAVAAAADSTATRSATAHPAVADSSPATFAASGGAPASNVDARGGGEAASAVARWHIGSLVVAAAALGLGSALHAAGFGSGLTVGLMIVAVVSGGVTTVRRALLAIRNRTLDMYVLMLVAVSGAALIGEWFEAATVVVLFSFAQLLERRSLDRARRAIGALVGVADTDVRLRLPHGGGDVSVPLAQVRVGDLMLVTPGERIALDGAIVGGASEVNQAPVTGESVPVAKAPGDRLFAGTINGHGALEVQVTAIGDDTTIARIIHLVERAQEQRAPSQAWVDRFAQRYTPGVLILAALVAIAPPLLFAQPFAWWIYRALVLLVIACPCALVLSTPISIVSGLAAAARRGVLIKGGIFLEKLAAVRTLALDKTGTLTRGLLTVREVLPAEGHTPANVIATAAALGLRSEHPLARAISAYAAAHDIEPPRAEALRALPGEGMTGRLVAVCCGDGCTSEGSALRDEARTAAVAVGDGVERDNGAGVEVLIGSRRLFDQRGIELAGFGGRLDDLAARGMTLVLVARAGQVVGGIGLVDELRHHSREAIDMLRAEGIRHVALLTGDHHASATAAGAEGRVDTISAGLLPADKVAAVERLRRQHGAIVMVGDGINDAPALAAADVGVAMGVAGTDAAIETADVALMADDLRELSYVIRLGRRTLRTVQANVAIALSLKLAFLALAISGLATLWMAVVADMGASLIVVANALRLLRTR